LRPACEYQSSLLPSPPLPLLNPSKKKRDG
jgi:hypothetical protein